MTSRFSELNDTDLLSIFDLEQIDEANDEGALKLLARIYEIDPAIIDEAPFAVLRERVQKIEDEFRESKVNLTKPSGRLSIRPFLNAKIAKIREFFRANKSLNKLPGAAVSIGSSGIPGLYNVPLFKILEEEQRAEQIARIAAKKAADAESARLAELANYQRPARASNYGGAAGADAAARGIGSPLPLIEEEQQQQPPLQPVWRPHQEVDTALQQLLDSIPSGEMFNTINQLYTAERTRIGEAFRQLDPAIYYISPAGGQAIYNKSQDMINRILSGSRQNPELLGRLQRNQGALNRAATELSDISILALVSGIYPASAEDEDVSPLANTLYRDIIGIRDQVLEQEKRIKLLNQRVAELSNQQQSLSARQQTVQEAKPTRPPRGYGPSTTIQVIPPVAGSAIAQIPEEPPRRTFFQRVGNFFTRRRRQGGGRYRGTKKHRHSRRCRNRHLKNKATLRSIKNRATESRRSSH